MYIFASDNPDNAVRNGSILNPFTVNEAVLAANPSDIIMLRGGRYEPITIKNKVGLDKKYITLTKYQDENVLITDANASIEAESNPLIKLDKSHFIRISKLTLGHGTHGIHTSGSSNLIIDNNRITEIYRRGIGGTSDNTIIENNQLNRICIGWENTQGGGGWPGAIQAWQNPKNWVVKNNYIANSWGESILASADGIIVEDNVIYNGFTVGIYVNHTRKGRFTGNLIYNDIYAPVKQNDNRKMHGFSIANEHASHMNLGEIEINNNIIVGCEAGVRVWWEQSATVNAFIHHNTIMDCVTAFKPDTTTKGVGSKYFFGLNSLTRTPLSSLPTEYTTFNNFNESVNEFLPGPYTLEAARNWVKYNHI